MSQEVTSVNTKKYATTGKVEVDGMIWDVSLPGAVLELRLGKVQRRVELLEKKIKEDNYDESDLDKLDALEDEMYGFFAGIFKDSTDDNKQVNEWLEKTPFGVIMQAFEDIKEQAKDNSSD